MFDIPIVINNFNRLTTTKRLVEDLYQMGYRNIHVLDNNSTYPPLLEWYEFIGEFTFCRVEKLCENLEQLAIYNSGYINKFEELPWVAYTDSDIELSPTTPKEFISLLIEKAEKYGYTKAGLALRYDDLPDNDYANHYRNWEQRYWQKELEKDVYDAHIDTTFCIIKPGFPFDYKALRVAGDLTALHKPWYVDFSHLDEEEKYYLQHSKDWSTYKRFYKNFMCGSQPGS